MIGGSPMATKNLYLCIDRPLPQHHKVEAARLAVDENKLNEPPPIVLPAGASFHPMKMAIITGKRWENGPKVGVRFLDGSKKQKAVAQKVAHDWSKVANTAFEF